MIRAAGGNRSPGDEEMEVVPEQMGKLSPGPGVLEPKNPFPAI